MYAQDMCIYFPPPQHGCSSTGCSSFAFPRLRTGLKAFPVAAWDILSYAKLRAPGRSTELA